MGYGRRIGCVILLVSTEANLDRLKGERRMNARIKERHILLTDKPEFGNKLGL